MEENNKKGFNTIYIVLGILTLVVAIIGATFAYFSASQTNNNITGNIAEAGGLVLDVQAITYDPTDDSYETTTGNAIIPLNLIKNQTPILGGEDDQTVTGYVDADSQFEQAMAGKCRDDLGNNICEVYRISVANQSATATVQIRGRLTLTSNAQNMYWKLIDATSNTVKYPAEDDLAEGQTQTTYYVLNDADEIDGILPVKQNEAVNNYLTVKYNTTTATDPDTQETITTTTAVQENVALAGEDEKLANVGANVTLAGTNAGADESTAIYYVVVWLEEIGTEQQTEDASKEGSEKAYNGTVTFDAVDANGNKSGVTATFLS